MNSYFIGLWNVSHWVVECQSLWHSIQPCTVCYQEIPTAIEVASMQSYLWTGWGSRTGDPILLGPLS